MNVIGPDSLVFGVEDMSACARCLTDYGLTAVDAGANGGTFEALDGTSIVLRRGDDASLPSRLETPSMLRETVYGVADAATLEAIGTELSRDRKVARAADGSLSSVDDSGFALRFQVTTRRRLVLAPETVNSPGAPPPRGANH